MEIGLEPGLVEFIIFLVLIFDFLVYVFENVYLFDWGDGGPGSCGVFCAYDCGEISFDVISVEDILVLSSADGQFVLEYVVDAFKQELRDHLLYLIIKVMTYSFLLTSICYYDIAFIVLNKQHLSLSIHVR